MISSTPAFGQSLSSPFASWSAFGRTGSPIADPFAPSPFGSSQTGSPIFGGTSTGVFGHPSSPLSSMTIFAGGASSSVLAFGSSMPASFAASASPTFGSSSSSSSCGLDLSGQKPAFGGFGSSPSQSSPFGSTFQQSQPAFGSNLFGSSTPFGASSQPAFGATSTPAFGATTTPAFGATTTPAFGSATTPAFGPTSTSIFGSTGTAFGASSTPAFGSTVTSAFGAPSTSPFGSSSTPAFGASSTPTFGSSSVSAFGASSTPSTSPFGSSSTPAFGASSTPTFGSSSVPAFVEEDLQTEEAQPHETYHPTKSETLAAVSGKEALMFDKGLNPAEPAGLATPPLSSSQEPIRKEILNPSSVQLKEAVQSAEHWTMATGSTLGQIQKEEGQNLAQPHEAFQPMELAASAAGMSQTPTLDEGLNPAQPQEAVPAPKPGTPAASSSLDEGLSPATLTLPRFSRIAEASSFQTLTKQVVTWAHLKGDVDAIKTMLQEEPVPTDHVEELLRNMISEESVSGYCFKDFRDSVSQILNEIKRQQSVNLDSVLEELTTAKSKQLSNLRQSVNRYKFLMRGYDKEVASEISLKAELVKNGGEIRTRMNTLEQELEQARNAFDKNEAQIHKHDEAISKARKCVDSVSQEIQKAEEECSQVEESLDKVGEEAEAKMRKQREGLQASKAVLLEFDMPQCLPRTY